LSATDLPFIKSRRVRWALVLLLASLPLLGWWSYGLFDLDEGFYASVTASMIRHHEWITPTLNGQPWFEKPILIYWFAKPAIMLFGQAFGPRLPSVLATIATYIVVTWFTRRHLGALAAVLTLFILASSLLVVAIGRMIMTDPLLLFFFTAAMLTFWESLVGDTRWRLLTAACLGFAVLAKGPVALILFALIAGWSLWASRTRSNSDGEFHAEARSTQRRGGDSSGLSFRGQWLFGILILACVVASWYVPAYFANGQLFVQDFLIKQNLGRFTGGDQAHTLPFLKSFWFYIPVLLLGMFPWILWIPAAWPRKSGGSEIRDSSSEFKKYLAAWALVVFIFFTISGAKLPHYILPCVPPLAILIGAHLAEKWGALSREELRLRLKLTLSWLVATWIIVQVGFEAWYVKSGQAEAHELARYIGSQNQDLHAPVFVYQLPRRDKDLGTGKPKLLETSLPSLSFYMDQDMIETDNTKPIDDTTGPIWVFTRVGRAINPSQPLKLNRSGAYYAVLSR
jgi:4-amino-4-deoxy-L-arabinose transferase-like glycosyltransferase